MNLKIVCREDWQARLPLARNKLVTPVQYVFCMCTNSTPCYNDAVCRFTCRHLQKFHVTFKKMHDVRYSFLIGGNGMVYEGRGWYNAPLLPSQYKNINDQSILIGFVGTFAEKDLPIEMVEAREELVKYGIENNYIKENCQKWEIFKPKASSDGS